MYLTYTEYIEMGGTLDNAAFSSAERKADCMINAQCGGRTGERISKLEEIPQAVKDCVYELITLSSAYSSGDKQIASESQSQGGASESYSYVTKKAEEIQTEQRNIIEAYLNSVFYKGVSLLYRGACV